MPSRIVFVRGAARYQRLSALHRLDQIVAASPTDDRGWHLHVIRRGRLAAAGVAPRGADPHRVVAALLAIADDVSVVADDGAAVEESELLLRWLDAPDTRLVSISGDWASPAAGAGAYLDQIGSSAPRDAEHVLGQPTAGWGTVSRPIAAQR